MTGYILKRIAVAILTLLLIMTITFLLMNAIPGSPFLTEKSTPEMIAKANAKYGLDKPLYIQLWNYIKSYLKGDLGTSLKMQEGTPVSTIIFHQGKFELSLKLGLYALLLAVVLGIPLGCIAAYNRGTWIDGFLRVITTVGVAIPTFVLATLLLVTFAVKLQWLPTISGSLTTWKAFIMPVISLITGGIDFSNLFIQLSGDTKYETLAAAQEAGVATINYGNFISAVINFLIMAFVIFLMVKSINAVRAKFEKKPEEKEEAPTTKTCPFCCSEIAIDAVKCPHCTSDIPAEEAAE